MLLRTNGYPLVTDNLTGSSFGDAYKELFVDGNSHEVIFEIAHENSPVSTSTPANSAVEFLYGNSRDQMGAFVASSLVTEDAMKKSGRSIFEDANMALDSRLYTNCSASTGYITKYATQKQELNLTSTDDVAVN